MEQAVRDLCEGHQKSFVDNNRQL